MKNCHLTEDKLIAVGGSNEGSKHNAAQRIVEEKQILFAKRRVIEEQKKSHHVDEVIGLMEAKTEVNNAPTLDVRPVVHAHWVPCEDEYEDEYKCSACGGTQFFAMTPQDEEWEYCPHCGAKMDERKTNEYSGE